MEPLPEMADMLRVIRDAPELSSELTTVASSPITLVMADERATVLENACGEPLDWECVGDAAGDPWVEIGGDESWTDVRPAFAPIESAIGLLGVGQAAAGYFGTSPIQPNDPDFQQWARRLAGAVPASALSGGERDRDDRDAPERARHRRRCGCRVVRCQRLGARPAIR